MQKLVDSWIIDSNFTDLEYKLFIDNELRTIHHLLDVSKTQFTTIEKFVYDTAKFHLNRLNVVNPDECYIDFWFKSEFDFENDIFFDRNTEVKNEKNYFFPLLSCITYLNDSVTNPTFITNIDLDTYKYKVFGEHNSITLSLPKTNKQISFDGNVCYGNSLLTECDNTNHSYALYINLWKKKPKNIDYYIPKGNYQLSKRDDIVTSFKIDNSICNIKTENNIIDFEFFNNLLYDKQNDVCHRFKELISNCLNEHNASTYVFEVVKSETKQSNIGLINDFEEIVNRIDDITYNRFLQRFVFNNIYSSDICKYIINEYKFHVKNIRETIENPIKKICVSDIPSIVGIINQTIDNNIIDKFVSSYNLNDFDMSFNKLFLDVSDLYIIQYNCDELDTSKFYKNPSFFSFSVLLNNDFTGGEMCFNDGLKVILNQGDLIIYNNHIPHSVMPISNGTSYFLVGFIDLEMNSFTR